MALTRLIFYGSETDKEGEETLKLLDEAGVRYSTVPVAGRPSVSYGRYRLAAGNPTIDYFEKLKELIERAPKLNFICEQYSPNS